MVSALDKAQSAARLLGEWKRNLAKAQEKVAAGSIDSFTIDALTEAAGQNNAVITLTRALERLTELALVETKERHGVNFPVTLHDESKALIVLDGAAEYLQERILGWYKPNSSSVSSVEIDLYANRANIEALKALRGKRF